MHIIESESVTLTLPQRETGKFAETMPLMPNSPYSASKATEKSTTSVATMKKQISTLAYTFEQGMKETIEWYLENTEWSENIATGDYVGYYEKIYGGA